VNTEYPMTYVQRVQIGHLQTDLNLTEAEMLEEAVKAKALVNTNESLLSMTDQGAESLISHLTNILGERKEALSKRMHDEKTGHYVEDHLHDTENKDKQLVEDHAKTAQEKANKGQGDPRLDTNNPAYDPRLDSNSPKYDTDYAEKHAGQPASNVGSVDHQYVESQKNKVETVNERPAVDPRLDPSHAQYNPRLDPKNPAYDAEYVRTQGL
jgi:hypothetical protein